MRRATLKTTSMNTKTTERRGILVPIDAHGINRLTLQNLVAMAQRLDRSLLGLLLDDVRLAQVAALPFAREVLLGTGREQNLPGRYAGAQSEIAWRTRQQLDELASRARVELHFESAAGDRLHSLLRRDGQLDIFIPARARWQLVSASYIPRRQRIARLGLVLTGSEQDKELVATAAVLLKLQLPSAIYVHSRGEPSMELLDQLAAGGSRLCIQSNFSATPQELARLIGQSAYDLLLIPRDALPREPSLELEQAIDAAGGQVLLIH